MHSDQRLCRRFGNIFMLFVVATGLVACDSSGRITGGSNRSAEAGSQQAPCDEATAAAKVKTVKWHDAGLPLTGAHAVVVEQAPDPLRHTVYRPANPEGPLPIVSWGNGGCGANGLAVAEYLAEIASHGYWVISNGIPDGAGEDPRDGSTHITALDWAIEQNSNSCSALSQRLDTDNIAVMGYSCGGLMSLNAADDSRVSTVIALNSGLLAPDEEIYQSLHTPVAYFNGGESDIAYANGLRDYQKITQVPVLHANLAVGHGGTYEQDNGGDYAKASVAWLNWHLKGDQGTSGRAMFLGDDCGLCNTEWVLEHKNF